MSYLDDEEFKEEDLGDDNLETNDDLDLPLEEDPIVPEEDGEENLFAVDDEMM